MFKEVADIKTNDQLNLPVPEAEIETVVVSHRTFKKRWYYRFLRELHLCMAVQLIRRSIIC